MTQRTKLELMEKKFERIKPWKMPDYGIFKVGREVLTYLWRVFKTISLMEDEGSFADVKWVEEALPSGEELAEVAETVNLISGVEIQWEEIEE